MKCTYFSESHNHEFDFLLQGIYGKLGASSNNNSSTNGNPNPNNITPNNGQNPQYVTVHVDPTHGSSTLTSVSSSNNPNVHHHNHHQQQQQQQHNNGLHHPQQQQHHHNPHPQHHHHPHPHHHFHHQHSPNIFSPSSQHSPSSSPNPGNPYQTQISIEDQGIDMTQVFILLLWEMLCLESKEIELLLSC